MWLPELQRSLTYCLGALVVAGTVMGSSANADETMGDRRRAMAVETIQLAREPCDYALTPQAEELIAADRAQGVPPFACERAVLATLWHETWHCNAAFAGENCMAARWQLCRQAYAEYGPDGIRIKGLFRAIIKK